MKVLLVSATSLELDPLIKFFDSSYHQVSFGVYASKAIEVRVVVTGIGTLFTSQGLTKALDLIKPDLCVHIGIAGSYNPALPPGTTVQVITEQFGDLGAEMSDGSFQDLFDLGLQDADRFPYKRGELTLTEHCPILSHLPQVKGLTVHTVTGTAIRKEYLMNKYSPDIESMEGMSFFYCSLMANVPFLALRSISNVVGPRDRSSWEINKAVNAVNDETKVYLDALALASR